MLQAEEALTAREIPVGCVLVHDGKVVARGRNRTNEGRNATLHAEFDALRHLLPDRSHAQTPGLTRPYTPQAEDVIAAAAEKEGPVAGGRKIWQTPLKGVVLYVTVEPCLMCASAMRQVGIEKVVYGCANDRFGGTGGVQSIHSECVHFTFDSPDFPLTLASQAHDYCTLRRTRQSAATGAKKRSCCCGGSTSRRIRQVRASYTLDHLKG